MSCIYFYYYVLLYKYDLEKWTYPMEDVTFVKNRTFKKIFNICFLNALYLTDSYQTSQF